MRNEQELMAVEHATSIGAGHEQEPPADHTPLYGHETAETAFVVEDYPYGYRLRCKIRYWIEYKPGKGYRYMSQTTNPKADHRWNKPKAGVYHLVAMAMYKDASGHVHYSCASEYTSAEAFLAFVKQFAGGYQHKARLAEWASRKADYLNLLIDRKIVWTINGIPKPESEADIERYKAERLLWLKAKQIADGSPTDPIVPYHEVSHESCNGHSAELSRAVRVF